MDAQKKRWMEEWEHPVGNQCQRQHGSVPSGNDGMECDDEFKKYIRFTGTADLLSLPLRLQFQTLVDAALEAFEGVESVLRALQSYEHAVHVRYYKSSDPNGGNAERDEFLNRYLRICLDRITDTRTFKEFFGYRDLLKKCNFAIPPEYAWIWDKYASDCASERVESWRDAYQAIGPRLPTQSQRDRWQKIEKSETNEI